MLQTDAKGNMPENAALSPVLVPFLSHFPQPHPAAGLRNAHPVCYARYFPIPPLFSPHFPRSPPLFSPISPDLPPYFPHFSHFSGLQNPCLVSW